ncbi:auxin-induced in root cultures protein 12 [Arachis duranensis]|uniref:Auxin-induced in root cultures protein 12 n=1 Tax=Arachis duranensis TaxID=130453 RepID=A0A6P4BJW4_ARADU|nr:auxin-induced in root cultures protein 12 [Arachis duranensis]
MASQTLLVSIAIFITLFSSTVHSLTCKSQKLSGSQTYANCTDLSALGATLHFTYNATNSSISVAFSAAPPSNGWVAWGVNTAGGGMIGAQALIAYKHSDGKLAVDLYNLTSYGGIDPVKKLSVDTWDVSAEESSGAVTIYAGVKIPAKADNVSQVWQVGPVVSGKPGKHDMGKENLAAKSALPGTAASAVAPAPASGSGGNTTGGGSNKSGAASLMGERFSLGFYLTVILVMAGFLSM